MRVVLDKGKQRQFFNEVLARSGCPSLHELINRGINVNYQTLKNYYSERRLLPENLFELLCQISGMKRNDVKHELVGNGWGQSKGGKISRKNGPTRN